MIIKIDGKIAHDTLKEIIARLEAENNVTVKRIIGEDYTILGLVGDISTTKERVENLSLKIL